MRVRSRYLPALCILALSCGGGATPADLEPVGGAPPTDVGPAPTGGGPTDGGSASTGVEGTAFRSPMQPVCRLDEPCRAPFSARFEVRQGERVVTRFRSDAGGHFLVHLAPGTYTAVPDASAPLLARSQVHEVTVGPSGLTHVEWDFDTGIR